MALHQASGALRADGLAVMAALSDRTRNTAPALELQIPTKLDCERSR